VRAKEADGLRRVYASVETYHMRLNAADPRYAKVLRAEPPPSPPARRAPPTSHIDRHDTLFTVRGVQIRNSPSYVALCQLYHAAGLLSTPEDHVAVPDLDNTPYTTMFRVFVPEAARGNRTLTNFPYLPEGDGTQHTHAPYHVTVNDLTQELRRRREPRLLLFRSALFPHTHALELRARQVGLISEYLERRKAVERSEREVAASALWGLNVFEDEEEDDDEWEEVEEDDEEIDEDEDEDDDVDSMTTERGDVDDDDDDDGEDGNDGVDLDGDGDGGGAGGPGGAHGLSIATFLNSLEDIVDADPALRRLTQVRAHTRARPRFVGTTAHRPALFFCAFF